VIGGWWWMLEHAQKAAGVKRCEHAISLLTGDPLPLLTERCIDISYASFPRVFL
jgi:hypothetical protein